jgi:hypothetical protein
MIIESINMASGLLDAIAKLLTSIGAASVAAAYFPLPENKFFALVHFAINKIAFNFKAAANKESV